MKIRFIARSGIETEAAAKVGNSVMQIAVTNGVAGIIGECGGSLACATCHCYVDEAWSAKTGEPSSMEADMLDGAVAERRPTSRLSCQIVLAPEHDGLIIELPETQI